MSDLLLLTVLLAGCWGLQMYLTGRQVRAFMRQVAQLRRLGPTATGVGGGRATRRVYVALASDASGRVVGARRLGGVTTLARPRPAPELEGLALAELADARGDASARAAAMAARHLLDRDSLERGEPSRTERKEAHSA
ncbi:MAG: transcriptional regulator GutM [Actinobacteria bacterium]|nr:transcriptional regulator GutM [Actinomycetota bacterium]